MLKYAKTLYKPEFPDSIKEEIKQFTKNNLPHFFIYAKDKSSEQVEDINDSFVNKLHKFIPNPRISFKYADGYNNTGSLLMPNYCLLMSNPTYYDDNEYYEKYKDVIEKYMELAKKYYRLIDVSVVKRFSSEVLSKSIVRQILMFNNAITETKKELSSLGYSDLDITDILVRYLYGIKQSKYKDILWTCYGDYIYTNIKRNFSKLNIEKKTIQCVDCLKWFYVSNNDNVTNRCCNCYQKYRKKRKIETQKERRNKLKSVRNN